MENYSIAMLLSKMLADIIQADSVGYGYISRGHRIGISHSECW